MHCIVRFMLVVGTLAMIAFGPVSCTAPVESKQGGLGEFCNNRDDDCKPGLICETGVCASVSVGKYSCEEMCRRLDECESDEPNCLANCLATLKGTCDPPCPWSQDAADAFGTCIVDELTCEEIQGNDAPQLCYSRLPLDETRKTRCDVFIDAALACAPSVDVAGLRNECYMLARTNTDDSWARTDSCEERRTDGVCSEIETCFNDVFQLEEALELGDTMLGGQTMPSDANSPSPG